MLTIITLISNNHVETFLSTSWYRGANRWREDVSPNRIRKFVASREISLPCNVDVMIIQNLLTTYYSVTVTRLQIGGVCNQTRRKTIQHG